MISSYPTTLTDIKLNAARLISQVKDKKELLILKECIDGIFNSILNDPSIPEPHLAADTASSQVVVDSNDASTRLAAEEYLILKKMLDNDDRYTSLRPLTKSIYNDPTVKYERVLELIREFLRNNRRDEKACDIVKEPKKFKTADRYKIAKKDRLEVKRLISDPYYSKFVGYQDYSIELLETQTNELFINATTLLKKSKTHAELESEIINAIPYAKNIKKVCDMVGRKSSGSMYKLIKDIIVAKKLQLGSKL